MKQSTKLLSLLLAVLMSISCFSVIGSAALDKSAITYDIIDDAELTYEQVSNLYTVYALCTTTIVKLYSFTHFINN